MLLFFDLGNTWWYFTTNTNFASDEYDNWPDWFMEADNIIHRVQVSIESVDYGTSEWSDELIVLTRAMAYNKYTNPELDDLKDLIVRYNNQTVIHFTYLFSHHIVNTYRQNLI